MQNNEILIPITFFLSLFGVLYVYFNTRHKERMSMIEKGADASLFQSKKGYSNASMRFGMFLIGIALGILTGNILTETTSLQEEVSYFSMIFLFGGMSLVSYYMFIERKKAVTDIVENTPESKFTGVFSIFYEEDPIFDDIKIWIYDKGNIFDYFTDNCQLFHDTGLVRTSPVL
ncbi:MAG: hypothetical protein IPG39_01325 [Bacteroidetes bacterium]|nr:hypothetical protein [Bacteroidota bacterium]